MENKTKRFPCTLFMNVLFTICNIVKESSGKLPIGFYGGSNNFHAVGLFDECLSVRAPSGFTGQYCTAFFYPGPIRFEDIVNETSTNNNLARSVNLATLWQMLGIIRGDDDVMVEPKLAQASPQTAFFPSIGLCIPSSCSAQDLGEALAQVVGSYVIANLSIVTFTDDTYCFKSPANKHHPFDGADISVM